MEIGLAKGKATYDKRQTLAKKEAEEQVLSEAEVLELANLGLKIEEHYGRPQDTEWAIEGSKIYMVQSRPITTLLKTSEETTEEEGKELIRGLGAGPGRGSGEVRVLTTPTQDNGFESGDVLVAEMTTPTEVTLRIVWFQESAT